MSESDMCEIVVLILCCTFFWRNVPVCIIHHPSCIMHHPVCWVTADLTKSWVTAWVTTVTHRGAHAPCWSNEHQDDFILQPILSASHLKDFLPNVLGANILSLKARSNMKVTHATKTQGDPQVTHSSDPRAPSQMWAKKWPTICFPMSHHVCYKFPEPKELQKPSSFC